ncbi:MAG: ABC transporter ATP-binding protein, partial [Cellulosilyticum sp.]|nr:ABC transporter ATP-binding protein [Cellulosilyticum sp.]
MSKLVKKEAKQKETIIKVLRYIRRYWGYVIVSILLATVTVISTLYIPILIGDTVDFIIGSNQVDFASIWSNLKLMIGVIGITALMQWFQNICNNKITYNVIRDVRNEAFQKIKVLPLKYIDEHAYGEVVSRVIADVDQFADGLLMGFTQLFTGILTIAGTLGFMLVVNVKITLVVVLLTPISLFVAKFIVKHTYEMFKLQSITRGEQTALIDEMIGSQKVVQAFGYEEEALKRFDEINEKLGKYSLRAIFFSSLTNPCTRFINSLVYAAVGIIGAVVCIGGGLTIGQLSCFLTYANQYTKPFNEISGV